MAKQPDHLLEHNRLWAERIAVEQSGLFAELALGQSPSVLWIGCSDSRVPETMITDQLPGDIFVHRNIANLIKPNDPSCMSVIQYAVEALKVKHIIVCGHERCGGINAAMQGGTTGVIDQWLAPIRDLWAAYREQVASFSNDQTLNAMCQHSVLHQLANLADTPTVQDAWARQQDLTLHGWFYTLADGRLNRLCSPISDRLAAQNMVASGPG